MMSDLFDKVRKLADLESGLLPDGTKAAPWDIPEFMLNDAGEAVRETGQTDPEGVWNVLRNGTEEEFSALINCIPEIGGKFDEDDALHEIMLISKKRLQTARDCDTLLAAIKAGFGCMFDKYF